MVMPTCAWPADTDVRRYSVESTNLIVSQPVKKLWLTFSSISAYPSTCFRRRFRECGKDKIDELKIMTRRISNQLTIDDAAWSNTRDASRVAEESISPKPKSPW